MTFNDIPQAMSYLINKVDKIEEILEERQEKETPPETKQWMSLKELSEYHPDHPAAPTVYGWVRNNQIPYYKIGKKLSFKKSEIDAWLEESRTMSNAEAVENAIQYINDKRLRR